VEVILILKHFPVFCSPRFMFLGFDRAVTVHDSARFARPCRFAAGI